MPPPDAPRLHVREGAGEGADGLDRREVGGQEPGGGDEPGHRLDGRDPPAGLPLEIGQEVADGEGVLRLLRAEEGDLRTLGQFRGEIFGELTGTAYAGEAGERAHLPPACGLRHAKRRGKIHGPRKADRLGRGRGRSCDGVP